MQALERLRDISLKGQFRKGVNNDSVSRDIERIEIREPDKTFPELREEVLRLYQDQELKRTRVRPVGYSEGLHESVMAGQVLTNHDSQVQAILESQKATNQHLEMLPADDGVDNDNLEELPPPVHPVTPRRSSRTTRGQHSNPFKEPRSVIGQEL